MFLERVDLGREQFHAFADRLDRQVENGEVGFHVGDAAFLCADVGDEALTPSERLIQSPADRFRYLSTRIIRHDSEGSAIRWPSQNAPA